MTVEEIKSIGWKYKEQMGSIHLFYRDFDGHVWFELYFPEDEPIKIYRKKAKDPHYLNVYYTGPCNTIEDLGHLYRIICAG